MWREAQGLAVLRGRGVAVRFSRGGRSPSFRASTATKGLLTPRPRKKERKKRKKRAFSRLAPAFRPSHLPPLPLWDKGEDLLSRFAVASPPASSGLSSHPPRLPPLPPGRPEAASRRGRGAGRCGAQEEGPAGAAGHAVDHGVQRAPAHEAAVREGGGRGCGCGGGSGGARGSGHGEPA
jgi:hypothetical protein